jgi:hypothetical protein
MESVSKKIFITFFEAKHININNRIIYLERKKKQKTSINDEPGKIKQIFKLCMRMKEICIHSFELNFFFVF